MVHVTSSRRLRRDEAKDRWVDATDSIGPCYTYFATFFVLGRSGIVVFFSLLLVPINRTLEGWSSLLLLLFSFAFPS
jgi:hypothetical protein